MECATEPAPIRAPPIRPTTFSCARVHDTCMRGSPFCLPEAVRVAVLTNPADARTPNRTLTLDLPPEPLVRLGTTIFPVAKDNSSPDSSGAEGWGGVVREIAEWARARGCLRLIEPSAPRRVGRLAQMRVAGDSSRSRTDRSAGGFDGRSAGAWSNASSPKRWDQIAIVIFSCGRWTPSVDFPWLTQEIGQGARDATVPMKRGA
jgi:hypothetical protein